MAIDPEVLRKAAEQYKHRQVQKVHAEDHVRSVTEMIHRCLVEEVCSLLSQSNKSVVLHSFWADDKLRVLIGINGTGLYNRCCQPTGVNEMNMESAVNLLIEQKFDPITIENAFWEKIQKIIDDAPK
jgi:Cdc6-like AAA superfamily ATPase